MNIESFIEHYVWMITAISLFFIPKDFYRKASISFLFMLFVSWFLGILVVEYDLIEYPERFLASVNETSFTFEFFVFPVIGIFFTLYYPAGKNVYKKVIYTSGFTSAIIIPEIFLEKYTDLIKYVNWTWYLSWISVFATFLLLRLFYMWYFKDCS
ncbi:hypothetical protein IM538_06870 [Cytobacillus suaedae]|nr:hypothetical protein IM538_06870 [Cytobacillus suaedae]